MIKKFFEDMKPETKGKTEEDIQKMTNETKEKLQELEEYVKRIKEMVTKEEKTTFEINEKQIEVNEYQKVEIQRKIEEIEKRLKNIEDQINSDNSISEMEKEFFKTECYFKLQEELKNYIDDLINETTDEIDDNLFNRFTELQSNLTVNPNSNFYSQFNDLQKKMELIERKFGINLTEEEIEKEEIKLEKYQLQLQHKHQLEDWTKMKCGNILFDSNIHEWSSGKSVLTGKIMGKSNLVFLIEDREGEVFGYYLSNTIVNEYDEWIEIKKGDFYFNLESHGRLPSPMKFKRDKSQYGYRLFDYYNDNLIILGDIKLHKQHRKHECYCTRQNPSRMERCYHNYQNAICGKTGEYFGNKGEFSGDFFELKNLVVIQME